MMNQYCEVFWISLVEFREERERERERRALFRFCSSDKYWSQLTTPLLDWLSAFLFIVTCENELGPSK